MMSEDKRSLVARQYDEDVVRLEVANAQARQATAAIRTKLEAGGYAEHFHRPVGALLEALEQQADLVLVNVRDVGGVPISRLGTTRAFDGRDLPVADAQPLANAQAERVRLFDQLRANHGRLRSDETASRPALNALPSL